MRLSKNKGGGISSTLAILIKKKIKVQVQVQVSSSNLPLNFSLNLYFNSFGLFSLQSSKNSDRKEIKVKDQLFYKNLIINYLYQILGTRPLING